MKYFYIILIILLFVFSCKKDKEKLDIPPTVELSFLCPQNNVQWIQNGYVDSWPEGIVYMRDIYTPDGDTILFGNTYYKLLQKRREIRDFADNSMIDDTTYSTNLAGLYRVDVAMQKMYYPEYSNGSYQGDELFMDFNIAIGDTLSKGDNYHIIVINKDSISLGGEYLRRVHYERWTNYGYPPIDSSYVLQVYDMPLGKPTALCGGLSYPGQRSAMVLVLNGDSLRLNR
ncbi:MAG: hypothetical protein KAG84_04860 [Bacteroidales bacterium]|nr:hypothetical protein [Bacteroidales bacterium]